MLGGTLTKWSSGSAAEDIGCGGRSTTKVKFSTSWSSHDAAPIGAEVAAEAAEKAGLCAEAYYHGQAQILRCGHPQRATYRYSRSGIAGEQSSREFTPAGTSTRTKTTAVQFTGIRPTVPFNPRRRLQRFLRPAPSFTPPHFQGVSSRDVRCLESRLVCCLIQITTQSCRTRQLTCQCRRDLDRHPRHSSPRYLRRQCGVVAAVS